MFNALSCMLCSGFLGFHNEFGGAAPTFNFKDLMVLVAVTSFADVANRDIIFPKIPSCKKECTSAMMRFLPPCDASHQQPVHLLLKPAGVRLLALQPRRLRIVRPRRWRPASRPTQLRPAARCWHGRRSTCKAPHPTRRSPRPLQSVCHLGTSEYVH